MSVRKERVKVIFTYIYITVTTLKIIILNSLFAIATEKLSVASQLLL